MHLRSTAGEIMSEPDLTPTFVVMCPCGGWVGVAVDPPEQSRENAKSVGRWMRAGFRIEKRTVDNIWTGIEMCNCNRRRKMKQKDLF